MSDDFINLPQSIDLNIKKTAPQTEIYLARGIEWDNSYIHARAYNSVNELLSHVISKIPSEDYHITKSAPVRSGKATVRIQANEAVAMKLNYMAFRNMPYDSEWHFAFINNVTWLSSDSVEIDFELDVFSECYYTTNFLPCFVERMHIPKSQDVAGANVIPDDIETGVMECYHHVTSNFGKTYLTMLLSEYPGGTPEYATHYVCNVYNGLYIQSYPADSADEAKSIDTILDSFSGKEDAIANMYLHPAICLQDDTSKDGLTHSKLSFDIDIDFPYSPKNQKLFTYPYCYVMVDDNAGTATTYKPELFSGNQYEFESIGCIAGMPQIITAPTHYNKQDFDYSHSFITSNFPIVSWSYDTYKAYVAQNKNSLGLGLMQTKSNAFFGMGKALGGMGSGNPIGSALNIGESMFSGYYGVQSIMSTLQDKEFLPEQIKGKINSENIRIATGIDRLDFYAMAPKASMCKVIDDFWTAFGYPIHQITTPQIHSRSSWNYIKTVDCAFTADAEISMLSKYRDLFNKGITIWHTDQIGNYNLSNV